MKALFVYNSNPAAVCPNHDEVVRGLLRPDLFTVVHEQFFTDTTDYADIVLPATTFFEHKDLQKAYGHYYLQVSNQAIEPLGECRSNVEVFRALAERMGFEEECFRESVDEMIDLGAGVRRSLDGGNESRAAGAGHVRLNLRPALDAGSESFAPPDSRGRLSPHNAEPFLPFAHGGFRTPSGKAELYSEALKALGLDPVAEFTPPSESRHGTKKDSASGIAGAQSRQLPEYDFLQCAFGAGDGRARAAGDLRGGCASARHCRWRSCARLQPARRYPAESASGWKSAARRGLRELNWAKMTPGFQSINSLTSEKLTDMGNSATFYSVLVEVEKIHGQ